MSRSRRRTRSSNPTPSDEEIEPPCKIGPPSKGSKKTSAAPPVSTSRRTRSSTQDTATDKAGSSGSRPSKAKTSSSENDARRKELTGTMRRLKAATAEAEAKERKQRDEEIQKRTAELRAQDEQSDDDSDPPSIAPSARKRRLRKVHTHDLDEDEEEIVASLGGSRKRQKPVEHEDDGDDEDENGQYIELSQLNGRFGEGDAGDEDADGEHQAEQENEDELTSLSFHESNNGMVIDNNSSSKLHRRSTSLSTSTSSSRVSNKWTEKDFPSSFSRLATLARTKVRERIALESAWPDDDKDTFTWKCFKDVAEAGHDGHLKAFQDADNDEHLKSALIDYAFYVAGGIRGDLKAKAKNQIVGHYQIPGNKRSDEIEVLVRWLLQNRHFMYGDVHCNDSTTFDYNRNAPFSHQIIADIIRLQFFSTKGKADEGAFKYMTKNKMVPHQLIILVICAVEFSLKEWSSGVHIGIAFSYENVKSRYNQHLKIWNQFATRSPTWVIFHQKQIYRQIIENSGKLHLGADEEEDDLNVDFDALEEMAQAALRA